MIAVDFKAKITMHFTVMIVLNILIYIAVFFKNSFYFFHCFFLLSVVDYHFHAIPDMLNLGLFSVVLFSGDFINSLHVSLIVVGFMTMLRYFVSYFLDKEAMGAFIGISMVFMSLFVAALLALPFAYIAKLSGKPVSFVPFLFMGTFLSYIFSPYSEAYLKSIGL